MITLRKSTDRGNANHGWLQSYHTFSFAEYFDPNHSEFRALRVINEDTVAAGTGFNTHSHKDMEIISYVLEGELEHKDSLGTGSVLRYGNVQRMSAGLGVTHSEFNHSKEHPVHFLQIWIKPQSKGLNPSYEEKIFSVEQKTNQLKLIVSQNGQDGSLTIHQDTKVYASILEHNQTLEFKLTSNRYAWVQIAKGALEINGITLNAGDGAAISNEEHLHFKAKETCEFLLFDLA